MINLLSQSSSPPHSHSIEMTESTSTDLNRFFEDVETIKTELDDLESLYSQLHNSNEQSKTLHNAKAVKELRSTMDANVSASLKKAKRIKTLLQALDKSSHADPGSAAERTRTTIINSLRKKLYDTMNRFNDLRQKMGSEYRETVERRYYTVTGENPDEKVLDRLIETGESETFMQKAIEKQGRGEVMDVIMEIQERHDAVREIERSLREMHQVFLDMAVLVQSQGEELDDIESQVNRASSVVNRGVGELVVARKHQKSTRKWACYGIVLLLIVVLIIILSLRPWQW